METNLISYSSNKCSPAEQFIYCLPQSLVGKKRGGGGHEANPLTFYPQRRKNPPQNKQNQEITTFELCGSELGRSEPAESSADKCPNVRSKSRGSGGFGQSFFLSKRLSNCGPPNDHSDPAPEDSETERQTERHRQIFYSNTCLGRTLLHMCVFLEV